MNEQGAGLLESVYEKALMIIELMAATAMAPEHQAQIINYLKATGIEIGLLINFGPTKLEYKRFYRKGLS